MSWLKSLADFLNPCIHQWERLDTLKDDEDNPNAIKIVRMCSICGEVDEVLISGPSNGCQHKWEEKEEIKVWPHGQRGDDPSIVPLAKVVVLRCTKCGELKSRKLTSEGFKDEQPEQPKTDTKKRRKQA